MKFPVQQSILSLAPLFLPPLLLSSSFMVFSNSPCLVLVMNRTLSSTNKAPCNCDTPPLRPQL